MLVRLIQALGIAIVAIAAAGLSCLYMSGSHASALDLSP